MSILEFGACGGAQLAAMLDRNGVRLVGEGGAAVTAAADLTVVLTDDYLHPGLAAWNMEALRDRRRWLLAKPVGVQTWIGPAFEPGATACWECLAQRLRWHRRVKLYAAACAGCPPPVASPAGLPASIEAALARIATEVVRWLGASGRSALIDRVVTTDLLDLATTDHPLRRRPQCPACGCAAPVERAAAAPIALRARPTRPGADGGGRAADPSDTLRRLEAHLSPVTGIIGALSPGERAGPPADGGDWATPTFAADHNFADMDDPRFVLREGMRRRSGGKGVSAAQARISALAESIERYCGVFDGTEPRLRARFVDFADDDAIHPNAVMRYSDRQYAMRATLNERGHKAHWTPEPFDEAARIDWSPLWSLTAGRTRHLPTSLCYFGYRGDAQAFGRGDSNGCAAGASIEEAILQGLLELIERDAVAIWWYNRLRRPGVDLDACPDPYVGRVVEAYRAMRREVWALDLTGDLGAPVFAALSRRTDGGAEDIIYGFGCHLDPRAALTRALTELNQSLEAVPAANGPEAARSHLGGAEAVDWWRTVRLAEHAYLAPDAEAAPVDVGATASLASGDLAEDVRLCVARAAQAGVEVLALDQTRPDIGFPVVRVVAPGLRHFWGRFGPGRLYDAPVALGWLDRPRAEHELNDRVVQF